MTQCGWQDVRTSNYSCSSLSLSLSLSLHLLSASLFKLGKSGCDHDSTVLPHERWRLNGMFRSFHGNFFFSGLCFTGSDGIGAGGLAYFYSLCLICGAEKNPHKKIDCWKQPRRKWRHKILVDEVWPVIFITPWGITCGICGFFLACEDLAGMGSMNYYSAAL